MERRTRLAAYIVAVNAGSMLLAKIAPGYPGAGRWTLPGGGVEFGEHPEDALVREVYEESGFRLTTFTFLGIGSRVYEARRPSGQLHAIRLIYQADLAGEPRVMEVDGSVDDARWVPIDELASTDTVDLVDEARRIAGLT